MKMKTIVFLGILSVMSSSALAQFFANAQIRIHPTIITATVHNFWGRPVVCSGKVEGITFNGIPVTSWFNNIIPAGQFRNAYVYTNSYNPFINATSNIFCR